MSLIIALGSNLGEPQSNLAAGFELLCRCYKPIALSRVYHSKAIGHTDQPDFFNQVAEFELPNELPEQVLAQLMAIESQLGRVREIAMGPRSLDLDLLFFGTLHLDSPQLTLPHPRLWTRSFVVLPLQELPGHTSLAQHFSFAAPLEGDAKPLAKSSTSFF